MPNLRLRQTFIGKNHEWGEQVDIYDFAKVFVITIRCYVSLPESVLNFYPLDAHGQLCHEATVSTVVLLFDGRGHFQ